MTTASQKESTFTQRILLSLVTDLADLADLAEQAEAIRIRIRALASEHGIPAPYPPMG
jgi:hypothetical protein